MATWRVEKKPNSGSVYEKGRSNEADKILYTVNERSHLFASSQTVWMDISGREVVVITYPSIMDSIKGTGKSKIELNGQVLGHIEHDPEYPSCPALVVGDQSKYRIVEPTDILFSPSEFTAELWKSGQFIGQRAHLWHDRYTFWYEFTTDSVDDLLNFVILDYLVCPAPFPDH